MVENKKEHKVVNMVKYGLNHISKIISANIFPPLAEGAEMVLKTVEKRIVRIEKRMLKSITSFLIMIFGSVFLIFSFFFFLIEYLEWTKTTSFLFIGIILFVIGLLLRVSKK